MGILKSELEEKYNVPVYIRWELVPINLHDRSWYQEKGVKIPKSAKPDAIKGGGRPWTVQYSFLFKEEKYLPEELRTKPEIVEANKPKLKVNFER